MHPACGAAAGERPGPHASGARTAASAYRGLPPRRQVRPPRRPPMSPAFRPAAHRGTRPPHARRQLSPSLAVPGSRMSAACGRAHAGAPERYNRWAVSPDG